MLFTSNPRVTVPRVIFDLARHLCPKEGIRPILEHVYVDPNKGYIEATDGNACARVSFTPQPGNIENPFLVNRTSIELLRKVMAPKEDPQFFVHSPNPDALIPGVVYGESHNNAAIVTMTVGYGLTHDKWPINDDFYASMSKKGELQAKGYINPRYTGFLTTISKTIGAEFIRIQPRSEAGPFEVGMASDGDVRFSALIMPMVYDGYDPETGEATDV